MNRVPSVIIALLLAPFLFAQSPQSDAFFAEGVGLYEEEKYDEAIEQFMKAYRLDSVELDSLSPRKSYSLSWVGSCYYKKGDIKNARKYAPYDYMVAPIDRRQTKKIDSISVVVWNDIRNQRFALALSEVKEQAKLETLLCDSNHTFNLGTNQAFCFCYNGLQKLDSVIYYLKKILTIERLYFEETDTLLCSTLNDLYFSYLNSRDYESAREANQKLISIIQYWFGDSVPSYAEMSYRKFFLFLAEREWQKARDELPHYLEVLQRCFKEDKQTLNTNYLKVINLLNNCGMKEEASVVLELAEELNRDDSRKFLESKLLEMANVLLRKDTCAYSALEDEINSLLSQQHKDSLLDLKAAFEYMRINHLFMIQDFEVAENLFLQTERDSIEQYLDKESGWYWLCLLTKNNMCLVLSDYEGSLKAIDELIKLIPEQNFIDNLNIPAMQACMYAFNGEYKKAREVAAETIRQYDESVVRYGMVFRLEKDTAQVGQILRMLEMRIQYADALPDSAVYVIREIKSEFLLLKARLLANLNRYQIDVDYYECISDYAFELIKMKKFIEAQEVMNNYIVECKACYESIDENSNEEDDVFDRLLGRMNYGEALAFRRKCYEKGDPNGAKAYWDYVEYVKEEYSESKDMEQVGEYLDAIYSYYQYTENQAELLEFLNRTIDEFKPRVMKTMADIYKQFDQPERYVSTLKKYVHVSIQDEESRKDIYDIMNVVGDIGRFYVEQKDTIALFNYYSQELWPSLDVFGDGYIDAFCRSLYQLHYKVDNESLIPYIDNEIQRKRKYFNQDSRYDACVKQAVAAVLMGKDNHVAKNYMRQACQQVAADSVLSLAFACNSHELLYESWGGRYTSRVADEELDSIIAFGYELISQIASIPEYIATADNAELIERQAYMLQKAKRYNELIELCEHYIQLFGEKEYVPDLIDLCSSSHKFFSFLDYSPLDPSYFSYHLRYIQDMMFYTAASSPSLSEEAIRYAQAKIQNEYDKVETSMAVNSVSPDECDKLISTTSKIALKFQTDSLKMAAYDAALFGKGLQLRSDFAIRTLIQKSGHKSALRKFDELQYTMRLMTNVPESKMDSLLERRRTLEGELRRMSSMFGDYKKSLYTSWKDVQKGLKQDEAAIEFTLVKKDYEETYFTNDTTILEGYYALILRKDMSFPEVMFITDRRSIPSEVGTQLNSSLTSTFFSPLKPYLNGVKKIFFSPIGALNQLPLESFSIQDNANHPEYKFYRVSSTRELAPQHQAIIGNDAVVYGGLKYDTSVEELEEDATLYPEVAENRAFDFSVNVDSLGVRHAMVSDIQYLAGTKSEAEDITATINNRHDSLLVAQSFIGSEGTEASFKSLNNKQKRIIHVATHGFYYTETEARQRGLTPSETSQRLRAEDRALTRSGLFFAGADNKYQGDFIPVGIEDGILTAQEISNINLSGADMVVLSACQTAQGENTSEGVFGLQRGFKKAGAQSILMSLWKVDDEATCMLMTEFYKNWMGGATKHDALEMAKQTVRSHTEKGWNDPKYWAAFILLDALD